MSDGIRKVLDRLLSKKGPTPEILLEVERLGSAGIQALGAELRGGKLSYSEQYRALQGLGYAAKHAGRGDHELVVEMALQFVDSDDIAVRSRASHLAVGTVAVLEALTGLRPDETGADPCLTELRKRVAIAVERAATLGLHAVTQEFVRRFLARENVSK